MVVVLSSSLILVWSCFIIFVIAAWKVLKWVWIKPKKMEKILNAKGFKGNSYRLLIGDLRESIKQLKSKPMNFNHDIIPRFMPFITNLVQSYGKKTFIWIGPQPRVVILEPDQMKEVFAKSTYVYEKLPTNNIFKFISVGLASYNNDKWIKHRRLINPAFSLEKLKLMLPSFYLSCSEMLCEWNTVASEGSFELDVWPSLQVLSRDAISRTVFGSNYQEGKQIFEMQQEYSEHILQLVKGVYFPGIMYLPTKRNRRIKALVNEIRTSVLRIVNRRMKAIQDGESNGGDDLLGMMLESNLKEIKEQGSNKLSGMSFEEIIDECKLFYFAGQETTSSLLVWTLLLLGKSLDWQTRARDEIRQIFGDNKPDYEGLSRLKVMNMIFNEVLRLYPPVGSLTRMIHEDTSLGDQTLPAGIQIELPFVLLHHDEGIWGADVNEFKPERFNEGVLKATKGQHVFLPFGSGPRVCIGQNFAMLEVKMTLSLILQSFSFETSPLYAHAPYTMISLKPQHGAQLILHKL